MFVEEEEGRAMNAKPHFGDLVGGKIIVFSSCVCAF